MKIELATPEPTPGGGRSIPFTVTTARENWFTGTERSGPRIYSRHTTVVRTEGWSGRPVNAYGSAAWNAGPTPSASGRAAIRNAMRDLFRRFPG